MIRKQKSKVIAFLLMLGLVYGCKKPYDNLEPQDNLPANNIALQKAMTWFYANKKSKISKNAREMSSFETRYKDFYPDWQRVKTLNLNETKQLLIVPVARYLTVNYTKQGFLRKLCLVVDNDEITSAKIIEIVATNETIENKQDFIFQNALSNFGEGGSFNGFTLALLQYDIDYNFEKGKAFDKRSTFDASLTARDLESPNPPVTSIPIFNTSYGINIYGSGTGVQGPIFAPSYTIPLPTNGNEDDEDTGMNFLPPPDIRDSDGLFAQFKTMINTNLASYEKALNNPNYPAETKVRVQRVRDAYAGMKRTIAAMEKHSAKTGQVFDFKKSTQSGISYNRTSKSIDITVDVSKWAHTTPETPAEISDVAHEVVHIQQFLDGALSFDKGTGEAGALYDITDEIQAYNVQYTIKDSGATTHDFSGVELPAGSAYVIDGAEVVRINAIYSTLFLQRPNALSAPVHNRNGNTPPATLSNDLFNYRR